MSLRHRLQAFVRWLVVDPRAVWAAIVVPLAALVIFWQFRFERELTVRIAGYAVTLAGVLVVVNGIRSKRQAFGRPTAYERTVAWGRRLPPIFSPSPTITATANAAGAIGMSGGGFATVIGGPTRSIEERLDELEENIRRANERISSTENLIRSEVSSLQRADTNERSARESAIRELRTQLEDLSVGGLDFEGAGVVWVIVGNAFTTFPAEIARGMTQMLR